MPAIRDTAEMIASMAPRLEPDIFHYCTTTDEDLANRCLPVAQCFFLEREGRTFILREADALRLGLDMAMPMRQITLTVHSALDGVGLMAAFARVLADRAIPCNVVAAYFHDHLFVPADRADEALAALQNLARTGV